MPDYLPEPASHPVSPVRRAQLTWQQRQAEKEVVRHELRKWVESEKDVIDTQAARKAITYAFEEEIGLYDYGMVRAEGSATKHELLARRLQLLSSINDQRIMRRFSQ